MKYTTKDLHILHGQDALIAADARREIWIGYYGTPKRTTTQCNPASH